MSYQSTSIQHGQFLRIEKYAIKAPHGKQGGNNIFKVAQESMRIEGFSSHVEHPKIPRILFGISALAVAKQAEQWSNGRIEKYFHKPSKTFKSRKSRADKPAAVVGIISVPAEWRDGDRWNQFCDACLAWLQKVFRDRLKCVLEHRDERCLHMHFWVIPKVGEAFSAIHPGERAIEKVGRNASRLARDAEYKKAMSRFLDDFYQSVGIQFELERETVGATRLSRAQWTRKRLLDEQREIEVQMRIAEAVQDALEKQTAFCATELKVRESGFEALPTLSAPKVYHPLLAIPSINVSDGSGQSFAVTKTSLVDARPEVNAAQTMQWIRPIIR
jgi:hypothetical protein